MADLINLRTARKNNARKDREKKATENRKKNGQSKLAKNQAETTSLRNKAHLDGHKLSVSPNPEQVEGAE